MLKFCILFFSLIVNVSFGSDNLSNRPKPIILKWMIAHEPNNYFIEMAKYFKKNVETKTNGSVKIEIVDDLNSKNKYFTQLINSRKMSKANLKEDVLRYFNNKNLPYLSYDDFEKIVKRSTNPIVFYNRTLAYLKMHSGEIDMAQGYTYFLANVANADYNALELPYVFDNYEHIENYFKSEGAKKLLTSTVNNVGMRGLAFTFSGGLLQTLSFKNSNMNNELSWKNKRFRTTGSYVRDHYMSFLGGVNIDATDALSATSKNFALESSEDSAIKWGPTKFLTNGFLDVEEINLPDVEKYLYKAYRNINHVKGVKKELKELSLSETQHTLLSTVFLISEKSFQKLNSKQQKVIEEVAIDAAKLERQLTIKRYNAARDYLKNHGYRIYTRNDKELAVRRQNSKAFYNQLFDTYPGTKSIYNDIEKSRLNYKTMAKK